MINKDSPTPMLVVECCCDYCFKFRMLSGVSSPMRFTQLDYLAGPQRLS
jgi:hypothetical protein